jgi:hypothetical protein
VVIAKFDDVHAQRPVQTAIHNGPLRTVVAWRRAASTAVRIGVAAFVVEDIEHQIIDNGNGLNVGWWSWWRGGSRTGGCLSWFVCGCRRV